MLSRHAEVARLPTLRRFVALKQFARQTFVWNANDDEHFVKVFNSSVENRVEKGRLRFENAHYGWA
jgi:hypothetical protein